MVKDDVSDVVVGAALPRVVEPEAERAGVPSIQSHVLPECTVLNVDGPVVDLHASDWKITARKHTHTKYISFKNDCTTLCKTYLLPSCCVCCAHIYNVSILQPERLRYTVCTVRN